MKFLHCFDEFGYRRQYINHCIIPLYKIKSLYLELGCLKLKTYDEEICVTPWVRSEDGIDLDIYLSELMKMIKRAPEWSTICCYDEEGKIDLFIEGD